MFFVCFLMRLYRVWCATGRLSAFLRHRDDPDSPGHVDSTHCSEMSSIVHPPLPSASSRKHCRWYCRRCGRWLTEIMVMPLDAQASMSATSMSRETAAVASSSTQYVGLWYSTRAWP